MVDFHHMAHRVRVVLMHSLRVLNYCLEGLGLVEFALSFDEFENLYYLFCHNQCSWKGVVWVCAKDILSMRI